MGNCIPASVEVIEVSDEDRRRHREAEWSLKKVRVQYSHPFFFFFNVHIRIFRVPSCLILTTLYFRRSKRWSHKSRYALGVVFCSKIVTKSYRKVLVLGSGDSGKSTVLKVCAQLIEPTWHKCFRADINILQQMRLIHRGPFSAQEVESFRQLVFNNLTHGLEYLLDSMGDMDLEVSLENEMYIDLIEGANDLRDGEIFPWHFYGPLRQVWNDEGVQRAWERGNEAALPEKYAFLFFSCCKSLTVLIQVWNISSLT